MENALIWICDDLGYDKTILEDLTQWIFAINPEISNYTLRKLEAIKIEALKQSNS